MKLKKFNLAKAYIIYRYNRAIVRKNNVTDESILAIIRNNTVHNDSNKKIINVVTQRELIADEVSKNLMEINDHIKIGISKNQALFEISDCKIVTRLLEGEFLDYNNVIPKDKETRITINKNDLQGAIERASIFSISAQEKEKKYPIKLNINIDNVIVSCTSQVGDAKEEVKVNTEGQDLEIGFNPKYLLDTLKAIEDDEICLDFGSNISPCVIRSTADEKFTYMVLPMRL